MFTDYIKFVLAYDYGNIFESMGLACDEAFELAGKITCMFLKYLRSMNDAEYDKHSEYEHLQEYCKSISFDKVWNERNEWRE